MAIRFGSVCSGIEAASVAWNPLGWEAAWFSEIEPFPCAVLKHHYPDVPNLGDMTTLTARILSGDVEAPDVFCGGTPCQAFSVAGLRKSLSDDGKAGTIRANGGTLGGGSETLIVGTLTASDLTKGCTSNQSVKNGLLIIDEK